MSLDGFGTVLAAQALYFLLQIVVDNGPAWHGARLAATGRLDAAARGSLVRVRLQLAAPAALVGLAIAAAGGTRSIVAAAPFMLALFLFALLNYWESFGVGDPRPWSAYLVLRSFAPAIAAGAYLAADESFPLAAAGIVECLVVLAVVFAFGGRPLADAALAVRARRGPWREVTNIGLASVVGQAGLVSGILLLNGAGAPASAAVLAVGIRLLTGVNGLSGTAVTSLFPRLASRVGRDQGGTAPAELVSIRLALAFIVGLSGTALAILLVDTAFFVHIFLGRESDEASAAAITVLGSALTTGFILLATSILVAHGGESRVLKANLVGAALTLIAGIGVLIVSPGAIALSMAVALASGQLAAALVLIRPAASLLAQEGAVMRAGLIAAAILAAAALVAASAPEVRAPVAVALLALTTAAAAVLLRGILALRRST
jgi:hypothetical protein